MLVCEMYMLQQDSYYYTSQFRFNKPVLTIGDVFNMHVLSFKKYITNLVSRPLLVSQSRARKKLTLQK